MSEIEEEGWCHYSGMPSPNAYDKTKMMRIEWLINKTHQVTNGSTVYFQGSVSDCKLYLNQNKNEKNN